MGSTVGVSGVFDSVGSGVNGVAVGSGASVGTVGVGTVSVGVLDGIRVDVGLGVEVGLSVEVGIGVNVGTGVEVGAGPSGRDSRVAVGLNRKPNNDNGVGVVWTVDTARSVTATIGVGLDPSLPVTGITIGLGIISPMILAARATAVLFMLPYDRSWVLRA
ncbi:MAG TPA: hypothetical protein VFY26_21050 [Anaerolineales bacterium]|nr:hypothetical protein [Anaerolineales bacterium]